MAPKNNGPDSKAYIERVTVNSDIIASLKNSPVPLPQWEIMAQENNTPTIEEIPFFDGTGSTRPGVFNINSRAYNSLEVKVKVDNIEMYPNTGIRLIGEFCNAETSVLEGLETGADDYITKPFSSRILLTRIENLIELRKNLQESIKREMQFQPQTIEVTSLDREFMEMLKKTLEENLSDMEFGVDELARALLLSRTNLNRKMRAITGESTNQFIQSYRLKRAAQLLQDDYGNVTEVAFAVGFSNSSYFTRCFKKKFHQLPLAYRQSREKNGNPRT